MTDQSQDRQNGDGLDITPEMAAAGRKALAVVADRMEEAKLLATSSIDFWQRVGHEPANEIYRAMRNATPQTSPEAAEGAGPNARLMPLLDLPPAEQFDIATKLAENVGYVLAPDAYAAPPKPAPDFEAAARALGFLEKNGKWFPTTSSPDRNTAQSWESAEQIFEWWGRASGNIEPAPDAVREAQIRRNYADSATHAAIATACEVACAGGSAQDVVKALRERFSTPVPPADGTEPKFACKYPAGDCLNFCGSEFCAISPSGTGAAEPGNAQMLEYARRLNDIATDCEIGVNSEFVSWRGHASDLRRIAQQIVASPPVRGDREALERCAKIADSYAAPNRFKVSDQWKDEMSPAQVYEAAAIDVGNAIAKDILSLPVQPGAGEREARAEDIAIALCLVDGREPDDEAPLSEMCDAANNPVPWWMVYTEYAESLLEKFNITRRNALSRQAPPSSSEGGR